ncbi:MAG: hypothetical protein M3Y57_01040 [Acidobacteriota bacterium]|nr:hypothetical protein [Acidobacteriota bacterium]
MSKAVQSVGDQLSRHPYITRAWHPGREILLKGLIGAVDQVSVTGSARYRCANPGIEPIELMA